VAAAAATAVLAVPAAAGANGPDLHDRVWATTPPGAMRIASETQGHTYLTASAAAEPVHVFRASAPDPVADQALVDFLGTLVHGSELAALRVHVAAPAEINEICGGGKAVACYAIGANRIYVPDRAVEGASLEYVLAHEYGHHIASWRSNAPWDAVDWGPKYWASEMRVCSYVRARQLFPGNQGAHYRDDPGEGFADSYAHISQPQLPWQFNALMRPTDAAFSAIRRDVMRPWAGPRKRTFNGRLGPDRRTRTFRLRLRLDGNVQVALRGRPGLRAQVELRGRSFATAETLGARRRRGFGVDWCRRQPVERVSVIVRRRAGAGPFALRVTWPG
jgi:hypothetical protein